MRYTLLPPSSERAREREREMTADWAWHGPTARTVVRYPISGSLEVDKCQWLGSIIPQDSNVNSTVDGMGYYLTTKL